MPLYNPLKGHSNASSTGESPRPPTYNEETPSTSSSWRGSRNPPLKIDKDTTLLVLPGHRRKKDEYVVTTQAGPSSNGTYCVKPCDYPSTESRYSARQLALPVETCGHLVQLANLNHQRQLKAGDEQLNELRDKLGASEDREQALRVEKGQYLEQLNELRDKLEACEDREQALRVEKGQYLMSVAGGHDYNSPFPSPGELIKRVNSFHETTFADVMDKMERVEHSVIKHMLVYTVRQCYVLAQSHVKKRLDALDIFLLGEDPAKHSHDAEKNSSVKRIAGAAFKEFHRYMFEQFYPSEGITSDLLSEVKDEVIKSAQSDIQPSLLASIQTGGEVYEDCIMELLQTFLECELTRPKPLIFFSGSFGAIQQWNSSLHINVDPSHLLDTEGKTDVQVILPGLYQAEGANDTEPEQFKTKLVVVRCEEVVGTK